MYCEEKDFVPKSHEVLKIIPVCKVAVLFRNKEEPFQWDVKQMILYVADPKP